MAGTQQENALVGLLGVQGHIGRSRHIARIIIAGMGHDNSYRTLFDTVVGMEGQKTVHSVAQHLRVSLVESSRLRCRPHRWLVSLSVA